MDISIRPAGDTENQRRSIYMKFLASPINIFLQKVPWTKIAANINHASFLVCFLWIETICLLLYYCVLVVHVSSLWQTHASAISLSCFHQGRYWNHVGDSYVKPPLHAGTSWNVVWGWSGVGWGYGRDWA